MTRTPSPAIEGAVSRDASRAGRTTNGKFGKRRIREEKKREENEMNAIQRMLGCSGMALVIAGGGGLALYGITRLLSG